MKSQLRLILLILCILATSLYANKKHNVLILHSYNQSYKWTNDINKGIVSILKDKFTDIRLYIEYMDTKRYVSDTHYKNLLNIYTNKYKDIKFDLIISSDNNAFNFLKKYNKTLFSQAPVVFCGVNYFKEAHLEGKVNFTGVNEELDIRQNYKLIKKIHPDVKNIYTIVDTTTTGKAIKQEAQKIFKELEGDGINYEIIDNLTVEELKTKVRTLPKNSILLISLYFRDKDNNSFEYYEISEIISKYSKVPLYGLWDFSLEHGIIGGYLTSGLYQGKEAGLMGLKILNGEKVENIAIKYKSPNTYMFDYAQVEKYKINPNLLPKESYIINKPLSFYEIYKMEIFTLIVLVILMLILIVVLLINIQKRKTADKRIKKQLKFEQKLIDTVNTPIYYKDKKGRYIGCNKAFEEHLEKQRSEIIGKTIDEVLSENIAKIYSIKDKVLFHTGTSQEYEGVRKFSDGRIKNLVFYKDVFYDEKNQIDGLVGAIFDITQLKEKTHALEDINNNLDIKIKEEINKRKSHEQMLIQQSRLAEMGEMISMIAHQWKQPLNALGIVIQNIHLCYSLGELDLDSFEKQMQRSRVLTDKMSKTIDDFRDFFKPNKEKSDFSINCAINQSIFIIDDQLRNNGIEITRDLSNDIIFHGFGNELSQVLLSIIVNAKDALIENKIEKPLIRISVEKNSDYGIICIQDNGGGVKNEYINKVFEPYFTTKDSHNGTGLGLYMSKMIVEQNMNGKLSLENISEGVQLCISLPIKK